MATNGSFAQQEQYKAPVDQYTTTPASIDAAGSSASGSSNLSKDEVGWYFVEQYYTTLSKSPEKLHLFYGKRSQFVYGREAQVANVSVGRQAIQERIKQLDFQDCKVRVSNVDSQASVDNIVIQVIGETSNNAGEPKKFVQTFVLAQQPSGYFVLNDILRYIEEGDDEPVDAAAEATEPEVAEPEIVAPAAESVETESVEDEAVKLDASVVDQKLEDVSTKTVNGGEVEAPVTAAQVSEAKAEVPDTVDPSSTAAELAEEDVKQPEKPKDPTPTPITKKVAATPAPAVQAEAPPAEPAAPPKPMTWASRAAAAAGPKPVVPLPKTATPPASNQSRAPAPAAAPAAVTAAQAATQAATAAAPAPAPATTAAAAPAAADASVKEPAGWQTAGNDSKRQNRPQSISGAATEKEGTLGYVKYVTDKVQEADLRNALAAHGELTYFDINRQKNCAFVEYKSTEGYQAAVNANPHTVNGENIVVEPRRPKSTAYGGTNYGSGRGGAAGRGRGGFEGNPRGGQGNQRGNFSGQNRGRGGAPRARGAAQAPSS